MNGMITEAELRELWQNGRGIIPSFPPGTRFSPSARDFLRDHQLTPVFEAGAALPGPASAPRPAALLFDPPAVRKTIYTEADIEELARSGSKSLLLNDAILLTELAKERAFRLGFTLQREKSTPPSSALPVSHNIPLLATPPQVSHSKEGKMGKTFYTDADIDALHNQGITRLEVNDQVVLTALAADKARLYGMELVSGPAPEKPPAHPASAEDELFQTVKKAVMARLGSTGNEAVVDEVIRKVIRQVQ
ncbi:MAG TPA: hypothetical protein PKW33_21060 [Anaerolineaceae bacterium]|nr:hypothetical protein [Anaerolineaceae bacterium]HPN54100.1 hypothetical protein [Anaerolineaceae bacterium]